MLFSKRFSKIEEENTLNKFQVNVLQIRLFQVNVPKNISGKVQVNMVQVYFKHWCFKSALGKLQVKVLQLKIHQTNFK